MIASVGSSLSCGQVFESNVDHRLGAAKGVSFNILRRCVVYKGRSRLGHRSVVKVKGNKSRSLTARDRFRCVLKILNAVRAPKDGLCRVDAEKHGLLCVVATDLYIHLGQEGIAVDRQPDVSDDSCGCLL